MEPARPSLSLLPSQVARYAVGAGIVASMLGAGAAVTFWPETDALPATTVAGADLRRDEAVDAAALQAAAVLRAQDRASRSGARSPMVEKVPPVVGRLWTTTAVNLRTGPSADDDRLAVLRAGARVGDTGLRRSGWTQVVDDGRAGWVKSGYLSKSKPKSPSPPSGLSDAACSISSSIEPHLTSNARAVYRAVCAEFGDTVSSFGGYRAGDSGDHGSGRAVDIMVSGDPGWDIARYVQAHARELGVTYVIYQQKIWMAGDPTSRWKAMEDRGSTTANHYNHVHVSVS
jgi:uncharacterized protein YraI